LYGDPDGGSVGGSSGNSDYWTREVQGSEGLRSRISKNAESERGYALVGFFDLSSVGGEELATHMVGIVGEPADGGLFDPESIVPASWNDFLRFGSDDARAYSLEDLIEIRVMDEERFNARREQQWTGQHW